MRSLIHIGLLLLLYQSGYCQEIRLGMVAGTTPIKRTIVDLAQYSPSNGFNTYLEKNQGDGIINTAHAFSSVHLGSILSLSYKRFSFNIEPQFYYERSVYRFENPYILKRVIGVKAFRMPFYFSYKFFKKESSSFILAGFNVVNETNWDFQHPGEGYYFSNEAPFNEAQNFGDGHFQNLLYDGLTYMNVVAGVGKKFKKIAGSIRFQKPIGGVNNRLPVKTWRIEMSLSWLFLSTKDFTNKHPLYVDE